MDEARHLKFGTQSMAVTRLVTVTA